MQPALKITDFKSLVGTVRRTGYRTIRIYWKPCKTCPFQHLEISGNQPGLLPPIQIFNWQPRQMVIIYPPCCVRKGKMSSASEFSKSFYICKPLPFYIPLDVRKGKGKLKRDSVDRHVFSSNGTF